MSDRPHSTDEVMRQAAESFSCGRYSKAHKLYGRAARAYCKSENPPPEKVALALYTRAFLTVTEQTRGNAASEIQEGIEWVESTQVPGFARFRGLFSLLSATWARGEALLESATQHLSEAQAVLEKEGSAFDRYAVHTESVLLNLEKGNVDEAWASLGRVSDHAESPHQRITAHTLAADVHEKSLRWSDAYAELENAAAIAFDNNLKQERVEVEKRMSGMLKDHPEAHGPESDA